MIDVAAGLIIDDHHRVLACRRPHGKHLGGKWEFPGGKLEGTESAAAALVRELDEELGITVETGPGLTPVVHDYGRGPIRLIPMLCRIISGTPEAREHSECRWCPPADLPPLDWADADLPILAEFLESHAHSGKPEDLECALRPKIE
jgi:8-oxo-dGTP diphosphatase